MKERLTRKVSFFCVHMFFVYNIVVILPVRIYKKEKESIGSKKIVSL